MKALHAHGFPTPTPIDQSRHIVAMSRIQGDLFTIYFRIFTTIASIFRIWYLRSCVEFYLSLFLCAGSDGRPRLTDANLLYLFSSRTVSCMPLTSTFSRKSNRNYDIWSLFNTIFVVLLLLNILLVRGTNCWRCQLLTFNTSTAYCAGQNFPAKWILPFSYFDLSQKHEKISPQNKFSRLVLTGTILLFYFSSPVNFFALLTKLLFAPPISPSSFPLSFSLSPSSPFSSFLMRIYYVHYAFSNSF